MTGTSVLGREDWFPSPLWYLSVCLNLVCEYHFGILANSDRSVCPTTASPSTEDFVRSDCAQSGVDLLDDLSSRWLG